MPEWNTVRELRMWRSAHDEHAFLLRCENLTYTQIGLHMGCSRSRARQRVSSFARTMRHRLWHAGRKLRLWRLHQEQKNNA